MSNEEALDRIKAIHHLAKSELNRINMAFSSGGSSMINVSDSYIDMLEYAMTHAAKDIERLTNIE